MPGTGDAPAGYVRPDASLLKHSENPGHLPDGVIEETSGRLVEALGHFGIEASVSDTVSGPRVTRYELRLAPGTKVARVSALRDDIAYALAARDEIRIIAPIPGKRAVGVEVPNPDATLVTLGDIYRDFPAHTGPLMTWLGPDISGKPVYVDLARMPHLLIAGSTGTGKSVCLNAILASILLRSTPDELRMILIDPKKVELNHYEHIPHLLTPVVTNMKDAAAVLSNVVREMESRYELMGMARARNLRDWNAIREAEGERPMPTVLVLIDELADLMMVAPAEVEDAIIRLAQKSRAVGIHLVLATQRPSADVITGMIKANVPSRIAFAVSSQVDSRVILDAGGAESLLGSGDMLFRPVGSSRLQRLQGAYVSEEEILAVTDHWRAQGRPRIRTELLERRDGPEEVGPQDGDEMLASAVELVVQQGTASVSLLQRRLGVGYARAGRLVDVLERMGVVSGHEGSKPRSVLIGPGEVDRVLGRTSATDGEGAPEDVERLRTRRLPNRWSHPGTFDRRHVLGVGFAVDRGRSGWESPCSRSATPSARRGPDVGSTSSSASPARRSGRSTSGRWRRSSSTSCPRRPTSEGSSAPTPSSWISTGASCSTSTSRASGRPGRRPRNRRAGTARPATDRDGGGDRVAGAGPRHSWSGSRSAA